MIDSNPIRRVLSGHVIFFASGIAGLGYQIVWTRLFAIGLGHEMPSMLAVVAAFFGGLAIGAFFLDGPVSRSRVPGRWYVALEVVIGAWALITIALIPVLNRFAAEGIGLDPSPWRHWSVAFAVPFLGLLPATVAMGATFPAMERLVARRRRAGGVIGGLYAVNTAGAVAGTVLSTFVIIPWLGFSATLALLAALNFLCAAATGFGPAAGERVREPVHFEFPDPPTRLRLHATIFMTGLLGIGYEILCVRAMAQVLENTVYSFASALAVFLTGTAVGASIYQRFVRRAAFGSTLVWLVQLLFLACLFGIIVLNRSGPIYEAWRARFGGGTTGSIAAEMLLAALVLFAPTVVMGALFSHLAQAARAARGGVGRALGINTLGSSLAPVLFGIVLLPALGLLPALLIVALGYLPLLPPASIRWRRMAPMVPAALLLVALPGNLRLVEAGPGARIVAHREGLVAAVAVTENADGSRRLKVNNRFSMGGTLGSFADRRQAHIPLLLHPAPRRALFLGLGTGITAGAATVHPDCDVTAVELIPEVVELLPWFESANRLAQLDPDRRCRVADARRFVRAANETWDVIVADLFHPARDGAGALYTREHFAAVRGRLAPGGLFCQWLPLYQLDEESVRIIVRTFLEVFPNATGYIAHFNIDTPMLGLVGSIDARRYSASWLASRPTSSLLESELRSAALDRDITLFGCLLADADDLRALGGAGPLNTDDHPIVIYRAPAFTYAKGATPWGRLEMILAACTPESARLFGGEDAGGGAAFASRVGRYISARNLYLRGQVEARTGQSRRSRQTMLESARASVDFRTAYVVTLQIALSLRETDRRQAIRLLEGLVEANPDDPRAGRHLRELVGQ